MKFNEKLESIQNHLRKMDIDGWLIYDFRKTNDIGCSFLEIPLDQMLSRRLFYWVPQEGTPIKIVNRIEDNVLDHLPGQKIVYSTWEELQNTVAKTLLNLKKVAMEYSPQNAIPVLSKVDGGTIEFVRGCGVEVVSSSTLLQTFLGVWTQEQYRTHLEACKMLDTTVFKVWDFIKEGLGRITEYEVQQFILEEFGRQGFIASDPPICAVNGNSANPHYSPSKESSEVIKKGDWVLIDLWCKKNVLGSVYGDITRVGVADVRATEEQQKIFEFVRMARDSGVKYVRSEIEKGRMPRGCDIDDVVREVIEEAGYGKYFIHRTGHSIDVVDHGPGTNIDNFETHDDRLIVPRSCFSIEPGIYLPGNFGVRLEFDVYIHADSSVEVTGGIQNEIMSL